MKIQAVRGMNDVLPGESARWQRLEAVVRETFASHGYREIRLPIVERTELFCRAIGDVTDIVEKEMYTFSSRSGESLSLRPEGTAGCVRACIQHGLLHAGMQRLWYAGPMFRYERPQAGRYRQFHQFGAEAFGSDSPLVDAELIAMSAQLWEALGIEGLVLQINTLGSPAVRKAYRERLVGYLSRHVEALDADSRRRLERNPLRILDSKDPGTREVLAGAPTILESLDEPSRAFFDGLRRALDAQGIAYELNPFLVRGLDYYTHSVFEWVTDRLGAQGTVCAGGRYDGLIEQLGGGSVPATGFAIGVERLLLLLETLGLAEGDDTPHVYLCWQGDEAMPQALRLAAELRRALPGLRLLVHPEDASLKSQVRRADRSGATYALIIAGDEATRGTVQVKSLRTIAPQQELPQSAVVESLARSLELAGG